MKTFYCTQSGPVVETKYGKLRGCYFNGVYQFRGIVYARAKRFHMPEEPECWKGVKDALAFGKISPVLFDPMPTDEILMPHRFWPMSEHCQNLNVWTNTLDPNEKRAVMVWFHGGGFATGSAIEHIAYDGDYLAKFHDVVVVTVNHRLNAFGFLDLSMFGEEYYNSGNAGIADLIASLRWVRENIRNFGGDPNNVTIFGQSGGGGKVDTLGQVEEAAGLYHKAVLMSGITSFGPIREKRDPDWKAYALTIMNNLDLESGDIKGLEKVPAALFIRAVCAANRVFEKDGSIINWVPRKNAWFAGNPNCVGFKSAYRKIPLLIGSTLGEFSVSINLDEKERLSREQREEVVKKKYGSQNGDKILELFRKAYPGKNEIYANDLDVAVRPPSVAYAKHKASDGDAPVYLYQFASCFDYRGGCAPWHGADIPFFFHNTEKVPFTYSVPYRERLEQQMAQSLVSFAVTGDPNNSWIPHWDPVTPDCVTTMVFDEITQARCDFDRELLTFVEQVAPAIPLDHSTPETEEGEKWLY